MSIRVLWEPRDCWVGVFWRRSKLRWQVYVCLVPCLPILFEWERR